MDSLTPVSVRRCTELTPAVERVLAAHSAHSCGNNDPESNHALAAQELFGPGVSFWTAHIIGDEVVGCAALKDLGQARCELKSMHVLQVTREKGVASALMRHVEVCARDMGFREILLETGSAPAYAAARKLYSRFGFEPCAPFADYNDDPNSIFMRLGLATR